MPERRHSPLVLPHLDTCFVGARVIILDEVDSTNAYALGQVGDGTVIVANVQTAGRGRQGRSWHSAPDLGLWFSVGFDGAVNGLSFAAALAVREALTPWCTPALKWPNDVLLGGLKVCGILVEHRQGRTALGIGINVHHRPEDFPLEVREVATSLEAATGRNFSRSDLLREVLTCLDAKVADLRRGGYEDVRRAWADACAMEGRHVRYGDTVGVVAAIDEHGALIVRTPHGEERRIVAGEISPIA